MKFITNTLLSLLLATGTLLSFGQAQAAIISIETDKAQYQVGDNIRVLVKLSDSSSVLSGFFLAMHYQQSALALLNWQHGTGFDDGLGSYQYSAHDAGAGRVALEDYADWSADQAVLAGLQLAGFTLAKLEFSALTAGQFNFTLDPAYLGLLNFAGDLWQPQGLDVSFNIVDSAAAVPATPVLALMICGLVLLAAQRRNQLPSAAKTMTA